MMRWFRWGTPRPTTEVNAKTKETPHPKVRGRFPILALEFSYAF